MYFTLVNTDLNWSTKMSAFPLDSDIKFPFCFKGDTPILSFFTFYIFSKWFRIIIVKAFLYPLGSEIPCQNSP